MRNAIHWPGNGAVLPGGRPALENFSNFSDGFAGEPCKQTPLEIIHRSGGIVLDKSIPNAKCGIGQPRIVAALVECKRVCVVDDIRGVVSLAYRHLK